jgi:hypothetical protein
MRTPATVSSGLMYGKELRGEEALAVFPAGLHRNDKVLLFSG